ncbi:ChbG/HpnK family deacetylase [Mesorhizobium sp. B2-7-3]|uniref:ChbG/HpnK family deacetylase n=1 Tax=unclassified Mesorhizobium TaxID=325217 RepID=UPI001129FA56|nr:MULTISPECIES: ChbG/HpnK family deacetylase [unclassified Mesorhizobium]MBZ9723148.1 ChbG/HpnK family deacetylase [Mesorhizobium sp. CO1-1-11]TPJ17430.1 ChbG/HpnK family deacetylase [Mesorhizobium sp. B2-7-3]
MTRRIRLIADDYGLAPGVCAGILDLLDRGRLTGTSCMTGFPEWAEAAARIKPLRGRAAIGLHLTLTDQPAVTGKSSLAPEGRLPPLRSLALPVLRGRVDERDVHAELDAQYSRFVEALGRKPDFIDGHQHVHFLPVVRGWLRTRFPDTAGRPVLRGAPALSDAAAAPKIAAIAAVAAGFNQSMQRAGFAVLKPLAGIYDWRQPEKFAPLLEAAVEALSDRGLFMCHPGHVDQTLCARDPMQGVREVEFGVLASDAFGASLARAGVEILDGRE